MLRFEGVRKTLGRVEALRGLSLHVEQGEVFGLLGPNGAGKSTTMSIACGLLAPDEGLARINGANPRDAEARRSIGLCAQDLALYGKLTARENLGFFAKAAGVPGRSIRRRVDELLDLIGLTDRAGDRVDRYSGGMKRRLNFAVALVHDPELVLLDEPTVGVDPHSRTAIFELVERVRAGGKTVVYTTHYMEEAQRLCDRVGIIDHGRLLEVGTVPELVKRRGGRTVVTIERGEGNERIETTTPIAVLAAHIHDADATGVRVDVPDLESVFLSLTGRELRDGGD